ncbi:MAG: DUF192 domain-containing protein [Puniceicoccaceae bacterium]
MPWRLSKSLPILLLILCACSPEEEQPTATVSIDAWLPLSVDDREIEVQVAITSAELRKGLMYRESLGTDQGMLFPYNQPQIMTFWMANTPIPLDIGFFDSEGVLIEIHRMYPFDTNRTVSRSEAAQFGLEMNRGWFASNGLFPGARLNLEQVSSALRQRGVNPRDYGLGDTN